MFPEIFCTTLKFQRFKNLFWEKSLGEREICQECSKPVSFSSFFEAKKSIKTGALPSENTPKDKKINCFPKDTINNVEISTFTNKSRETSAPAPREATRETSAQAPREATRETLAPTRSIGDAGKPIPVPKNRIP